MTLSKNMLSVCLSRLRRFARPAAVTVAILIAPLSVRAAEIPADFPIDLSNLVVSKDELVCLALNDYWEARSESIAGRVAVARVVLNRAMDSRFPSNICDVVMQSKNTITGASRCQFSWVCEGKDNAALDPKVWRDSLKIAAAVLQKDSAIPDPTGGALWYHASFLRPNWAIGFESTTIIGEHVFYREPDDLRNPLPPRKPFIYRLSAFAEFAARRKARAVAVAMAPEAAESAVPVKDGAVSAQPVAR